ncbi:unnamed protein product [Orchesella dallaii]|uniref:Zinc finger PHD-type domain-containing protein n=1 Tax=Orchesella dallaii TaxID=48710 RepID=A0ABP1QJR2_9HEXA
MLWSLCEFQCSMITTEEGRRGSFASWFGQSRSSSSTLNSVGESARESTRSSTSSTDSVLAELDPEEVDKATYESVTCWCGKSFAVRPMIECDYCLVWYHMSCEQIRRSNIPNHFKCSRCKEDKRRRKKRPALKDCSTRKGEKKKRVSNSSNMIWAHHSPIPLSDLLSPVGLSVSASCQPPMLPYKQMPHSGAHLNSSSRGHSKLSHVTVYGDKGDGSSSSSRPSYGPPFQQQSIPPPVLTAAPKNFHRGGGRVITSNPSAPPILVDHQKLRSPAVSANHSISATGIPPSNHHYHQLPPPLLHPQNSV